MKVYLIYAKINKDEYENLIKYILSNAYDFRFKNGFYYGLYAWTDKKEYLTDFLTVRGEHIYDVIKIEFDSKEEYKKFKNDKKEMKLDYYSFDTTKIGKGNDKLEILTTFNEFNQSTEYSSENIYQFIITNLKYDYMIFKNDIIDCLDIINYTTEYDTECGDEYRTDNCFYNKSFSLTSMGRQMTINMENQVNILLVLFKYFYTQEKKE